MVKPSDEASRLLALLDDEMPQDPAQAVELMQLVIDGLTLRIEKIEEDLA